MDTIFDFLKTYAEQYEVIDTRNFTASEIAKVKDAEIVASTYGTSVCFFMHGGGQKYIPTSRDSVVSVGDKVDLHTAKILTLEREGERINRVEIV